MNVEEFLSYIEEAKSKSTLKEYKHGIEAFAKWFGKDANAILALRHEDMLSGERKRKRRFAQELEKFHAWLLKPIHTIRGKPNQKYSINPAQKIINEIGNSLALFALITSNVLYDKDTRDWVLFEIGVAKGKGKPMYCWKQEDYELPKVIDYITDYDTFVPHNDKDCLRVVQSMVDKALELKERK